ncbi:MAG: rRNA maturation RNase YbeY [Deltaproteobacteria bacterium]|nr:rRNA maturation RNase YbeY [Deltaproteobacteria bacterium]
MPNILKSDSITLTAAPVGWALPSLAQKLLDQLRAEKLLPPRSKVVLSISCVNASRMAALNFKYRQKRRPTDVLSFEQPGAGSGTPTAPLIFLGDLVLCVPVVKAQAREQGHGVRCEAAILLAHGLLHLLGFDHEKSRSEAIRMAMAEDRVLFRMGLGRSNQKGPTGLTTRGKVIR